MGSEMCIRDRSQEGAITSTSPGTTKYRDHYQQVGLLVLICSYACGCLAGTQKQFEGTQQGNAIGAVKRHCPLSLKQYNNQKNIFLSRFQNPKKRRLKSALKPIGSDCPEFVFAAFLILFLYHLANGLRLAGLGG